MVVINTNAAALWSSRLLANSNTQLNKSLARLSSGSRIVSPEDDAAGLGMAINFQAQIHRNDAVSTNIGNAVSFSQTEDGVLQKTEKALDRMGELSMLAQDTTKTDEDRANYNSEFNQLFDYIFNDLALKQFNGVNLFGATSLDVTIDSDGSKFSMNPVDFDGDVAFNIVGLSVDTVDNANIALNTLKGTIENLASDRAKVGANLARLFDTNEALEVHNQNLMGANSRIQDVDVAQESAAFARHTLLVQSGTAMLTQANQIPQSALKLLAA